ncbi:MAG: hypothetical protein WC856_10045 [Methylococcaceae bacterium]|jgi:hypothetical protein
MRTLHDKWFKKCYIALLIALTLCSTSVSADGLLEQDRLNSLKTAAVSECYMDEIKKMKMPMGFTETKAILLEEKCINITSVLSSQCVSELNLPEECAMYYVIIPAIKLLDPAYKSRLHK